MQYLSEKGHKSSQSSSRGGGGYLVYFADGMCTPFRVSISPLFSSTGYRSRALFADFF